MSCLLGFENSDGKASKDAYDNAAQAEKTSVSCQMCFVVLIHTASLSPFSSNRAFIMLLAGAISPDYMRLELLK